MSTTHASKLTQSAAWKALQAHQKEVAGSDMRALFAGDSGRAARYTLEAGALLLDYSKQRITDTAPESAMQLVGQLKVLVPLGAFINRHEELLRLDREISKTRKELEKARTKLGNGDFVARAPQQVVDQERKRLQEFEATLAELEKQRLQVDTLTD